MKRMRIAIYSGAIPSTTFIERLIDGLAKQGFEIILFGTITQSIHYASKNIKVVGNHPGLKGLLESLIRFARLHTLAPTKYKKLKKHLGFGPLSGINAFRSWQVYTPVVLNLPDIFHIQWAKTAKDWIFLKEKFGIKLVLSLRGTHISISPLANENLAQTYRKLFPMIDAFHSVCDSILEEAVEYGAKREKIQTIYSGLNVQNFKVREWKPNQVMKLLVIGRFHWKKGYQYLLDALVLLKKGNIHFKVTLIAQGNMPEEILFQLHDLNLKNEVNWINGLPHDQVIERMKEHDALILPSLSEGIANVVLEAMNVGLLIISTDCDGMKEAIQDGINGFLVPVRNPKVLANAIVNLNNLTVGAREGIRMKAHATIERQFNMENSKQAFAEMYKQVLA
jgi:glycosyltransferase involved in cell wall biosynthesis